MKHPPHRAQVVTCESDFSGIDVFVPSIGEKSTRDSGFSDDMHQLYHWATTQDVEIIPLEDFLEQTYGFTKFESDEDLKHIRSSRQRLHALYTRGFDVVGSVLLLILLAMPMMMIAITIIYVDGHPVLFRQDRLGKGRRIFSIYKFRTMQQDDEQEETKATRLGAFLRKLHLDELPQLLNILKGEMSFIGPRPEWVLLTTASEAPDDYGLRLAVRPGLSGWAQVNYKPSKTKAMRTRKLTYDLYYIKHRSIFLDMLIYLRTFMRFPAFFYSKET